jgi:hydroxymethylbilane synthase
MRRRALLTETRRDLEPVEFRGNLDTRLEKVAKGVVSAAILAAAGLERLGAALDPSMYLDPEWWVPAPGQGALAIEGLTERTELRDLVRSIADPATSAEVATERAFGARLEGGCTVPLGCSAVVTADRITVTSYLGSPNGGAIRERLSGNVGDATDLGIELAEAVLLAGGEAILIEIEARPSLAVEEP